MDFAFLPFTDHFLHPLIHRHSSLVKNVQGPIEREQTAELFRRFFQKPRDSPFSIFAARHNSEVYSVQQFRS